MITNNHHI